MLLSTILLSIFAVFCSGHNAGGTSRRSLGGLHDVSESRALRATLRDAPTFSSAPTFVSVSDSCNITHVIGGYWEACGGASGNIGSFRDLPPAAAQASCCSLEACAGFSFVCNASTSCATGSGFYKANADCGFVSGSSYQGYYKPSRLPVIPNVSVAVTPATPLSGVTGTVSVAFTFLAGAPNASTDWVAQVCVGYAIEDYIEYMPLGFFPNWDSGSSAIDFPVFRSRCDFEFRYFRGKQPLWPSGVVLGVSNPVTWAGASWATSPFHTHIAFGGEDTQHSMIVSFSTNYTAADATVMVGTQSGVYDLPNATEIESTTYGPNDLCNAPANETSMDFWQWPGVFWHATLRGLAPSTRYFVRPVAGGVAGDETSFVTGKTLGPDIPVTFASYGDMSDTYYVLDGDSSRSAPNGGPGATGTASRLRQRIDEFKDIDFVTHYGDLGYAKGAIWLWDAWMSMMSYVAGGSGEGGGVPYLVR